MNHTITNNHEICLCQCNFATPFCCHMEYCCPCVYLVHEPSYNLSPKNYSVNDSHKLLNNKKEKELFLKRRKNQKNNSINDKNNAHYHRNKTTNFYNMLKSKSLKENGNTNIETGDNIINMIKNAKKDKNPNKKKTMKKNIENNNISMYKKIKLNNHKQDRATTCPTSNNSKGKVKKIDMNNCIPINYNKKVKAKYFNKYELNKSSHHNKHKISINKKSVGNIKNYNSLNFTENLEDFNFNSNYLIGNKLKMGDSNDDILDINKNVTTDESSLNQKVLQNLKNKINQSKKIINDLKIENESLKLLKIENEKIKNLLNSKEENINKIEKISNNVIKVNKSTNTTNYDYNEDKEKDKIQRTLFEKEVINLKNEISKITEKLTEYENFISILKQRNTEQETIIKNKDKEIQELIYKLQKLENENKNLSEQLNMKNEEILKESLNVSTDLRNINDNLKKEIEKLKQILVNKDTQIKELEIKLKYEKKFDIKKQKLLELLFNFYLRIKKSINFDKLKETLKELVEIVSLDDFQIKLINVEKKFIQIIDDIQIKYGHCFACDIACCTSHVDKLKSFRKMGLKK